jgi:ferrochelatase
MARTCSYEEQLRECSRLVAEGVGRGAWELVYQSRSGPPSQPWLEPDICDWLEALPEKDRPRDLVVVPLGFLSDHMEVIFDLDTEAAEVCRRLGIQMVRAKTVGCHPRFVRACRELIQERLGDEAGRPAVGRLAPCPDICPPDCCPPPNRPQPSGQSHSGGPPTRP